MNTLPGRVFPGASATTSCVVCAATAYALAADVQSSAHPVVCVNATWLLM
jgi:hypothetical protein